MGLSAQVAQPLATASNGSAAQQPGAAWPALAAALAAVLAATARHLPADWLVDDALRGAAAEAAATAVSLAAPRRAQRDGGDPIPMALSGRPEADRDHLVQVRTVKCMFALIPLRVNDSPTPTLVHTRPAMLMQRLEQVMDLQGRACSV